ncbi:MAG: hypothetical protein HYR90_01110 [Candidatus Andersenbacteria bacterium]|nr:hypothetical protein [Candidatus Andersenbacteria bacterium]MBI3251151.1 hypothetical protein [Candidatus Andersenbacteria bacterium]
MIPWQQFKVFTAWFSLLFIFVGLAMGAYVLERTHILYFASLPRSQRVVSVPGAISTQIIANPVLRIQVPASSIFAPAE